MKVSGDKLIRELEGRGLIAQVTGDGQLSNHLDQPRTVYCGFDPTADSLHLGHLVPLLVLRRLQDAGHTPVALVGGATGLIGDPSFKATERQLNTPDVVAEWSEKIRVQVSQFLRFDGVPNPARVVNNLDWTASLNVLDFLRDVGKHFSVNNMINKESVKQRLVREGAGISFTEFSYSLLQALDFAELNKHQNCTVQIGGSDQWGNIVAGIELSRRLNQAQVFGLTTPLVTKADGTKFGKTESGAVWLDPARTSAYAIYQFWINTADADVYTFLKYFTFLSIEQISAIEESDRNMPGRPQAQEVLAREATRLVHGDEGLDAALRITEALFSGDSSQLSVSDFQQLQLDGLPSTVVSRNSMAGKSLTSLFADWNIVKAGREAVDALKRGAVFVNNAAVPQDSNMYPGEVFAAEHAAHNRFYLIRVGKKKHHLLEVH